MRVAGRGVAAAAVALLAVAGVALAIGTREDEGGGPPPRAGSATGDWRALAPATVARGEVAAARIGRYIYVVGGFQKVIGADSSDVLERYDIRRNRWRRLRPIPVGVNHPTAAALGGRLYVHGGYAAARPHQRHRGGCTSTTPAAIAGGGCPTPASRARPTPSPR